MAILSLKTGNKGRSMLAAYDPGVFIPIASTVVGSGGVGSIIFDSIPTNYQHLQIRAISKNSRSNDYEQTLYLTFNSDYASGNYRTHRLVADGSSTTAQDIGNNAGILGYASSTSNNSLNNIFGISIWDILDYKNPNKYKTVKLLGGNEVNGSGGRIILSSGLWTSTNIISSIQITVTESIFLQYSHFALYGIKG